MRRSFRILSAAVVAWIACPQVVCAQTVDYPLTDGWSGPGFYLQPLKILACWAIFAMWVHTTDWVSDDAQERKLDYKRWNPVIVGSFLATFVLAGDVSGWSDEFLPLFDLCVLLKTPKELRMERIERREYARWGDRVLEGGDMYESQRAFREFAENRDVAALEQRALVYPCPRIEIINTGDCGPTAQSVAAAFYAKP